MVVSILVRSLLSLTWPGERTGGNVFGFTFQPGKCSRHGFSDFVENPR